VSLNSQMAREAATLLRSQQEKIATLSREGNKTAHLVKCAENLFRGIRLVLHQKGLDPEELIKVAKEYAKRPDLDVLEKAAELIVNEGSGFLSAEHNPDLRDLNPDDPDALGPLDRLLLGSG
jgi:hypothetical protein